MVKVVKTVGIEAVLVGVKGGSVIDEIERNFDVFSKPDDTGVIILDTTGLEDDKTRTNQLCDILGIRPASDDGVAVTSGGYVIFYA